MVVRGKRMDRFVLLPLNLISALRCDSKSSVSLATTVNEKSSPYSGSATKGKVEVESRKNRIQKRLHRSWGASLSHALHKFMKRFENFSQIFVLKLEEEEEKEMEIGFPTDVKHLTHIGLDGSSHTYSANCSEILKAYNTEAEAVLSSSPSSSFLPAASISLQQFELAMAAQSQATLGV